MNKKNFYIGILSCLILFTLLFISSCSSSSYQRQENAMNNNEIKDYLFVITADYGVYAPQSKLLVLKDVTPLTVYFLSKRGDFAGQIKTQELINAWNAASDAIDEHPPNIVLSYYVKGEQVKDVVLELEHPRYYRGQLSFNVTSLPSGNVLKNKMAYLTIFISNICSNINLKEVDCP